MAPYRCLGSLLLISSFVLDAHGSPNGSAKQIDLMASLSAEDAKMFAAIWAKYTHGEFMSQEELNALMGDTDQELGDPSGYTVQSAFNHTEWLQLCEEKGADPSKGLSKHNFLSLYFDGSTHPESSIKNDFLRIFAEGGTPAPPKDTHKNVLQESGKQADLMDSLSAEDAKMFAALWWKYSHGEFMSHEQLNKIMGDTDHELEAWGGNSLNHMEWVQLCEEKGADPRKGLSKRDFLSLYFDEKKHPESSIKNDFMRIFAEGGTPPPPKDTHKNVLQEGSKQVDLMDSLSAEDAKMFEAIWWKYSHGEFISHEQLNKIMGDTDHELGDAAFNHTEWVKLCEEKGADPSKGLSKHNFLSLYFDDSTHPESSIKNDFLRIFAEGGTPAPPKDTHKNMLQESGKQADLMDSLSAEDAKMFAALWWKYSNGEFMSHEQLNKVMGETDQELEEYDHHINHMEWVQLCEQKGADPSKGLTKSDFLSLYLSEPNSSIKNDFLRVFAEGGTPPPKVTRKSVLQETGPPVVRKADLVNSPSTEDALPEQVLLV